MAIRRTHLFLLLLVWLAPATAVAQSGRITGKVIDDSGQPLPGVSITATRAGEPEPLETKSDEKGEFTFTRMAEGEWALEFTKEGFQTQRGSLKISEEMNVQKVDVTLAKAAADPNAEIQAELKKAEGMLKASQYVEARKVYEDLLAKYPTVIQLYRFIAATYAGEKNYPKAVEQLRVLHEKEPENLETKLLLADLLIEAGEKEEGLTLLQSVDIKEVKDPYPFINAAITLIRDNRPEEAITMLNDLLAQFPNQADIYYYRGRAYIAAKKLPEGKADIEKFVAVAPPDARELADAKKILEQLKDVK